MSYMPFEPQEYKNNRYSELPQDIQERILERLNYSPFISYADRYCIVEFLSSLGIKVEEVDGEYIYMTPEIAEFENECYEARAD